MEAKAPKSKRRNGKQSAIKWKQDKQGRFDSKDAGGFKFEYPRAHPSGELRISIVDEDGVRRPVIKYGESKFDRGEPCAPEHGLEWVQLQSYQIPMFLRYLNRRWYYKSDPPTLYCLGERGALSLDPHEFGEGKRPLNTHSMFLYEVHSKDPPKFLHLKRIHGIACNPLRGSVYLEGQLRISLFFIRMSLGMIQVTPPWTQEMILDRVLVEAGDTSASLRLSSISNSATSSGSLDSGVSLGSRGSSVSSKHDILGSGLSSRLDSSLGSDSTTSAPSTRLFDPLSIQSMSITPVAKPISPSCQVDPQVKKRAHTYIRSMPTLEQLHRIYDQVRLRLPEGIRRKEFYTLAMAIASYNRDRRHAFLIPLQSFSDMALVHLGSGSNGHVFRGVCLNDQPSRANRNKRVALQSRLELIERIEAGHQCIAVKFSTDSKNLSMGATRMARVSAAGGPVVHYSWFHKYIIKEGEGHRGRDSVMCVHTMSMIDGVILESMLVMPPDTKPDLIHILRRMGDGDRRSLKQSFVRTVARIAAGSVLSLRALHRHVLHRDLKPDNMSASYSPEAMNAIRRGEWGNFIPKVKYFDLDFSEDTEPLRVYEQQQTSIRSSSSSQSVDISGAPAYASERVLKYGESGYQFADDLCALCYSMWHIMHTSEFGRIFFDSATDCRGRDDYMKWFARVRKHMFKSGSTIRVKHAIPKQILELCRRQYERSFFQIEYLSIAKLWLRAGGWDTLQGFDAWWEQEVVRLDLCTILAGRHIPPNREIRVLCTAGPHTHDLTRDILDRIGIVPRHEGIKHEFVTLKQSQRYRSNRLYRRYDSLCAGMVPGLSLYSLLVLHRSGFCTMRNWIELREEAKMYTDPVRHICHHAALCNVLPADEVSRSI